MRRAGDDDAVARDGSEEDRSCAGTELDAGDTAAGAALRAHVRSVEVQQLRLVRDERQLLVAGLQFDGTDDDVVALERDDLHDRLVRVLRRHALDDARRGTECEAGGVGAQRRHRQHLLAGCEVDERGDGRAAVEDGRLVRVDEVRQFERADTEQPTCGRDDAELTARAGARGGEDDVVLAAATVGRQRIGRGGARDEAG